MSKEIHTIGVVGASGGIGTEVMRQAANYPNYEFVPIGRKYHDRWLDFDQPSPLVYRSALRDLDAIIHLAAMTSEQNDPLLHYKYNFNPTATIAKVASENGIPFIYAGSTAMYTGTPYGIINDKTPADSDAAYGRSKILAHEVAQKFKKDERRETGYKPIQVVPGATFGPDTAWTHLLTKYMKNPVMRTFSRFMLESELGWSDMEDVANLFILIATNPYVATSERYLAVNGNASLRDIFKTMSELSGLNPLETALPREIAEPIGRAALTVAGKKAKIAPETFSFGLHGEKRQFKSEAARRDYGWEPKSLEQTLREIKEGYKPKI